MRKKPTKLEPVPYWKNQYNQKIIEKFNQLDLDIRMKIVGSNMIKKSETRLKSHSGVHLPRVARLRSPNIN